MRKAKRPMVYCMVLAAMCLTTHAAAWARPSVRAVLEAMKRAAGFMANEVSTNGGYVYRYSADLSERWGEVPARESQIWTQPPGTPAMGGAFLDAYEATGEAEFLRYAEKAADALVWGQHPAGGWHYLIDFDMTGIRAWYEDAPSRFWGWEEYYHYYGNCTFDDESTYAPTKFLLDLYMTTLDPAYRVPLLRALDFILEAQYPAGGWPQRYPLMFDYPHDGHEDYTHYYTYNDGVQQSCVDILFEAWERLGDERYRDAAVRGMDFYLISQCPEPQAGWAQQYAMDMKPAAARSYEPAAVSLHRTLGNINDLMRFYTMTGDRRYLEPIPRAVAWIERSVITTDPSKGWTHAGFYEPGTNEPLYYHFTGTDHESMRSWVDHDIDGAWWYRRQAKPDIGRIRREYERMAALSPEEARAAYLETKRKSDSDPPDVDAAEVARILESIDDRGAWVTEISIRDYEKGMLDVPPRTLRGIDVRVFIDNMRTLAGYVKANRR